MAIIEKNIRMKKKKGNDTIISYPQTVDDNILVDGKTRKLSEKMGEYVPARWNDGVLEFKNENGEYAPDPSGGGGNTVIIMTIPTQNGSLTYDGASKTPTWNDFNGEQLAISGATNGTNAGSYTAIFTPKSGYKWLDGTTAAKNVTWTIGKAVITAVPTQNGSLTYTGSSQNPAWNNYDSGKMTLGGTTSGTNATSYNATFTPTANYMWSDSTTAAKTVAWSISKAAGSLTIDKTSLTLNASAASGTIAVTRSGDGAITATSSDINIATVTVSGTTVTVNNVGQKNGAVTITIKVAAGTNHNAPADKTCAVTASFYSVFGVSIDLANTDSALAVTYTDDAVGMTGGSTTWDSKGIFKDIKPCVLKGGVVQYYLNPADFTKKADNTAATITGTDGDVMIEIPKTGFQINTSGNILTIKITDDPAKSGFKYYAHSRDAEGDRNKLYIGAYKGCLDASKLRSFSGKAPHANETIGAFRTKAQANGAGYDLVSFYPLTLLQCLFIIRYKSLNSQAVLGRGYVDGNSAAINTGGANAKGMFFGETTGKLQMKCFGIEDLWGNVYEWIDGLWSDASRNICTAFKGFNDTGASYTSRGQGATSNIGGYMSKPQGTTEMGFIAKEVSGSETTYFADSASLGASHLPSFGGNWGNGGYAGVFQLDVANSAGNAAAIIGGRLMYL